MTADLQEKIRKDLTTEKSLEIRNSTDFYFQKAQDVLRKFLQLEVSDEVQNYLQTNKKNYEEIKQYFEDSEDLAEFGNLIFTLISYCDLRAYNKNLFNKYEDKRVLAAAFVRMDNWVEQIITYKFENYLPIGSVKNAIDYLLNPEDNFTMLSENHRKQISEKLLNKDYDVDSFSNDVFNFFDLIDIDIKNKKNLSHLLTRIMYKNEIEWKESIIGLVCPDTTGWQKDAVTDTVNGNHIVLWNHKKPNGTSKTLKLLKECIAEKGFFRIFYTSQYNVIYVAEIIDFVIDQKELDSSDWHKKFGGIEWYHPKFNNYADGGKSASWVYLAKKIYKVDSLDFSNFTYYNSYGYPSVGCQAPVISYDSNFSKKNKKNMDDNLKLLRYKKQIILQGPPGTGKTRAALEIANNIISQNNVETKTFSIKTLTKDLIKSTLKLGQKIEGKNKTLFEIVDLQKNVVVLKSESSKPWRPSYSKIINSFNNQLWKEKGRTGGFKSYEDAIARYFYENHLNSIQEVQKTISEKNDFLSIIQFHPSYTYEDFVRGIVAKPSEDGEGIMYEAENKTLGKFAEDAKNDSDNSYVLIIDEINRANLSSVLGELIYALEYRGEEVESMYEVDGSQKLILPQNLYIIGTMNTADRSVGHIDYAIRRRFAFVEVPPKPLVEDEEIYFNIDGYNLVADLFIAQNVSPEFEIEDVQIGHSYFIAKKSEAKNETERDEIFKMKMQYEVLPILEEYVKDGILVGKVGALSIRDFIKSLKK